jgi:hypothetical protein
MVYVYSNIFWLASYEICSCVGGSLSQASVGRLDRTACSFLFRLSIGWNDINPPMETEVLRTLAIAQVASSRNNAQKKKKKNHIGGHLWIKWMGVEASIVYSAVPLVSPQLPSPLREGCHVQLGLALGRVAFGSLGHCKVDGRLW